MWPPSLASRLAAHASTCQCHWVRSQLTLNLECPIYLSRPATLCHPCTCSYVYCVFMLQCSCVSSATVYSVVLIATVRSLLSVAGPVIDLAAPLSACHDVRGGVLLCSSCRVCTRIVHHATRCTASMY